MQFDQGLRHTVEATKAGNLLDFESHSMLQHEGVVEWSCDNGRAFPQDQLRAR